MTSKILLLLTLILTPVHSKKRNELINFKYDDSTDARAPEEYQKHDEKFIDMSERIHSSLCWKYTVVTTKMSMLIIVYYQTSNQIHKVAEKIFHDNEFTPHPNDLLVVESFTDSCLEFRLLKHPVQEFKLIFLFTILSNNKLRYYQTKTRTINSRIANIQCREAPNNSNTSSDIKVKIDYDLTYQCNIVTNMELLMIPDITNINRKNEQTVRVNYRIDETDSDCRNIWKKYYLTANLEKTGPSTDNHHTGAKKRCFMKTIRIIDPNIVLLNSHFQISFYYMKQETEPRNSLIEDFEFTINPTMYRDESFKCNLTFEYSIENPLLGNCKIQAIKVERIDASVENRDNFQSIIDDFEFNLSNETFFGCDLHFRIPHSWKYLNKNLKIQLTTKKNSIFTYNTFLEDLDHKYYPYDFELTISIRESPKKLNSRIYSGGSIKDIEMETAEKSYYYVTPFCFTMSDKSQKNYQISIFDHSGRYFGNNVTALIDASIIFSFYQFHRYLTCRISNQYGSIDISSAIVLPDDQSILREEINVNNDNTYIIHKEKMDNTGIDNDFVGNKTDNIHQLRNDRSFIGSFNVTVVLNIDNIDQEEDISRKNNPVNLIVKFVSDDNNDIIERIECSINHFVDGPIFFFYINELGKLIAMKNNTLTYYIKANGLIDKKMLLKVDENDILDTENSSVSKFTQRLFEKRIFENVFDDSYTFSCGTYVNKRFMMSSSSLMLIMKSDVKNIYLQVGLLSVFILLTFFLIVLYFFISCYLIKRRSGVMYMSDFV